MYHSFFIYSSISGHLNCFNILDIVNNSARSCCVSVTQSWHFVTPVDNSMLGFLVLYYLLEFAQIHVQWVNDAIKLSHSLSSPSLPALSHFQHQGLFQWVSSSHQMAKVSASVSVLPMNIQDLFPLGLTCSISLQSKGLLRVFSNATVQKHQFFSTQLSSWSNTIIHTWLLEKS